MKKLFLVLLLGVSVGFAKLSDDEFNKLAISCLDNETWACERLVDENALASAEECSDKDICDQIGYIYRQANHPKEAIKYYQKAIKLGSNEAYGSLANLYYEQNDFVNARKNYEIVCNLPKNKIDMKVKAQSYYNLGVMYRDGQGVKVDYKKAAQYFKMACDLNYGGACSNLGYLYGKGQGVRYDLNAAKNHYGKACDLGNQIGCDNYKKIVDQKSR